MPQPYKKICNTVSWGDMLTHNVHGPVQIKCVFIYPLANIHTDAKHYIITLTLPGLTNDEIQVSAKGHLLVVSAQQQSNDEVRWIEHEFDAHNFCREFIIPEEYDIDKRQLHYSNGLLSISIPLK